MPEQGQQDNDIYELFKKQDKGNSIMKIRISTVVIAAILAMAIPQNAKCG